MATALTRSVLTVLAASLALTVVSAPAQAKVERPIVYAIVLDGLDGDAIDAGHAPFIASLLAGNGGQANYYRESRSVMLTETNPNHVAMMTGAYAESSGIPGNGFALYAPLQPNSCVPDGAIDETKAPTPTSGEDASCLLAQTVFEAVKQQGNPDDLVTAALLGKPKLGAIFAGRHANGKQLDADYLWAPCSGSLERDDEYCKSVQTNPGTGYAVNDEVVMDAVIETLSGVPVRGRTQRPDFTFVNLPQVDSAGHAFGPGPAYNTTIGMADDQIERLVTELRQRGEWERTVLILLSDHSMDATPQKTSTADALTDAGVSAEDFVILGNGSASMVYLTDRTSPQRFGLLKRMRAAVLNAAGVSEALYREPNPDDGGSANTLDSVHPGWRLAGPRTGDLVVLHEPAGAFSDSGETSNPLTDVGPSLLGQHGGPQTRDNFFAVTGGGPHVRQAAIAGSVQGVFDDTLVNTNQAENVDVAPTVMGLLGLSAPRDSAGRFLSEAFELARLPGNGAPARGPRLRVRRLGGRPRSTEAARRRCKRGRVGYRLSWTPPGGRYDLQARRGKRRFRALVRDKAVTTRRFRGVRGARYRLRIRARGASGAAGPWTVRRLRVPCR